MVILLKGNSRVDYFSFRLSCCSEKQDYHEEAKERGIGARSTTHSFFVPKYWTAFLSCLLTFFCSLITEVHFFSSRPAYFLSTSPGMSVSCTHPPSSSSTGTGTYNSSTVPTLNKNYFPVGFIIPYSQGRLLLRLQN